MTVLSFFPRRRRSIFLLAAAGLSGYSLYRLHHLPAVSSGRRKLINFISSLLSITDSISSSANSITLLSSDLNRFLLSDSDQIPSSLNQLSKIMRSDDLSTSISTLSEAFTVGIIRGMASDSDSQKFSDKLLDKMFSTDGSGFASVVIGSFARNLVTGFYSNGEETDWVNIMCAGQCRELIAESIQRFVETSVAVYLDKTMDVNTYDDFFSGLTNPSHVTQVKEVLVSVCNGAVETLVKTSHDVLTSANSSSSVHIGKDASQVCSPQVWVERVSSVLAVPSNKQFVLDVTGRLTFESVRSFLEFLLWKIQDGVRRGVNVFREEVVVRCLDLVRNLSAKVMLAFSLSLAFCLRLAAGPKILIAA